MKVKCIKKVPEANDILPDYLTNSDFHITEDNEYLVFGIYFSAIDGSSLTSMIKILSDYNKLITVPISFFEVVDKNVSKYWQFNKFPNGEIAFLPPSFARDYYDDDLFEGEPEIVEDFKIVKKLLEEESKCYN